MASPTRRRRCYLHVAAGGPESAPIFFSIDEDIDAATWKSIAVQWLRGINSVLGVERTGVYGSAGSMRMGDRRQRHRQLDDTGVPVGLQTRAWSNGEREPAAVLYQRVIVTPSDPGISLGESHVDEDDILAADYGQWDLAR